MITLLNSAGLWLNTIAALSWKGSVFALVVGLAILLLRRRLSPAWRHSLWLLVLLRLATPDLGTSPWSMGRWMEGRPPALAIPVAPMASPSVDPLLIVEEAVAPAVPDAVLTAPPPLHKPIPWTLWQWLTLIWLLGAVTVISVMAILHLRMRHRVRRDNAAPSSVTLAALRQACEQAGIKRAPNLIFTNAVKAPALFGIIRPAILLPHDLAASCDATSLNLILLHELAHLQRRDLWAQVAASLIIALHWFNPIVWWAGRRLRCEAEMAADARALRRTDAAEAHRLGEVLLGFANHAATGWMVWFAASTVLGISQNKRDLRQRIEALMDLARGRRAWWITGFAAFAALAVIGLTKAPAEEVKVDTAKTMNIKGVVVDENGKPIPEADCIVQIGELKDRKGRKTSSDKTGHFKFDDLPEASSYKLSASTENYMFSEIQNLAFSDPPKEYRIVLPAIASWVSGTVTNKETGKPIQGASVYVEKDGLLPFGMSLRFGRPTATTDEAGHYYIERKSYDNKVMNLVVHANQMAVMVKKFEWTKGKLALNAELEKAPEITGKVVNAEGQPVRGALLSLNSRMVDVGSTSRVSAFGNDIHATMDGYWVGKQETDADGSFSTQLLELHAPNNLWLVVHHGREGLQRIRFKDWKPGETIKLEHWNTLEGTLSDADGKAVKGAKIDCSAIQSEPKQGDEPSFMLSNRTSCITNEQGHYKFEYILPRSASALLSVDGVYTTSPRIPMGSGETRTFNLRLKPAEPTRPSAPKDQLRRFKARIITPEGYKVLSDEYEIAFSVESELDGKFEKHLPNTDGQVITTLHEPGYYTMRVIITPRDYKTLSSAPNNGVAMRLKLDAAKVDEFLDLGDIKLEASDFAFRPVSERATSKPEGPRPRQRLNAPIAGDLSFVTWTGGSGSGVINEQPLSADGRIFGLTPVGSTKRFIIRGTKADGSRYFTTAQPGLEDAETPLETPLSFTAGIAVAGEVIGLPADYKGDGCMVAAVTVREEVKLGAALKGPIPSLYWYAWTPVAPDGKFRFKSLPRGKLSLTGYGKSWTTRHPNNFSDSVQLNLTQSEPPAKLIIDSNACTERRVQLLLPDGKPAVGATVSVDTNYSYNHAGLVYRGHAYEPEDLDAYRRYQKFDIPGHQATTDAQGFATLRDLPPNSITCKVKWTDPHTKAEQNDKLTLQFGFRYEAVQIVKLAHK